MGNSRLPFWEKSSRFLFMLIILSTERHERLTHTSPINNGSALIAIYDALYLDQIKDLSFKIHFLTNV